MDPTLVLRKASELLETRTALIEEGVLYAYVDRFLQGRDSFLACSRRHGTPVFAFDEKALLDRAGEFTAAFAKEIPGFQAFFAMKSNNHPLVSRCLVGYGLGLDVSSGLELDAAIETGCDRILFSGPGKTAAELEMAAGHADRVTVLMDSFRELDRLEAAAGKLGACVRAGVRLTTQEDGLWRKFGIPLSELGSFMDRAAVSSHVDFRGLQFHTSWNHDPGAQVAFLKRLGRRLQDLTREQRERIGFLDIGGGYWPSRGEWAHFQSTPAGRLVHSILPQGQRPEHYVSHSSPIEVFARGIGACLAEHIFPHISCGIYAEPGRWLVNDSMHMLLTVVDKKAEDLVIVDGGTNSIGWERYESDYCPVINLSRPSLDEKQCMILGALCTPHDVWGYGYFGEGIETGDVLLIPSQGAYTYSLRQHFIKPPAGVVPL